MIRISILLFWIVLFLFLIGDPVLLYKVNKIQNELKQINVRIDSMFTCRNDTLKATERRIRAEALAKMAANNKLWIDECTNEIEKVKFKPKWKDKNFLYYPIKPDTIIDSVMWKY